MARTQCPNCTYLLVPPAGPTGGILLVGEFPGPQEQQIGQPFVGQAGDILRAELGKVGISYSGCRVANLWQHRMVKDEVELNWHMGELMKEVQKARFILFMGSECAKTLFHLGVLDTAGLKVKAAWLPDTVKVAMLAPNPAVAMHDTLGELRLSLQKFAAAIQ